MTLRQVFTEYIQTARKSTLELEELERLFAGQPVEYEAFAKAVLELERAGVLELVKAHGRNGKVPALGYQYRIRRDSIVREHARRLHGYGRSLHPCIQLDRYYSLSEVEWQRDWPYIEKIDRYLRRFSLPEREAPAPERSFELVGDEKWITDKGGQAVLERLGLWTKLRLLPVSDPLMLAVNPAVLAGARLRDGEGGAVHRHLIVENKTTFQGLAPVLPETSFATLIYGCGRKIVGNLEMLRYQYPVPGGEHLLYYFGDIDLEGISIWFDLRLRHPVRLAEPFYRACLAKQSVQGKEYQLRKDEAVAAFCCELAPELGSQAARGLDEGRYWPQETLASQELGDIWRTNEWNGL
ncbi:MAG: hypothetical protein K0R57_4066 [Paenibacillaceae bacterium]|nr:hypothetical protein [Paenibacillaceae bacterium]